MKKTIKLRTANLITAGILLAVGLLAGFSSNVWAGVYGAGPYGACDYGGGTCVVPGGVQNLTLTPGDNQITANWAAPSDDGGSAITGYIVKISSDGGATWLLTDTTTNTSYIFTGLNAVVTYTIQVYATNAVGDGATSSATGRPAFINLTIPVTPPTINVTPTAATRFSSTSFSPSVETNVGYSVSLSTDSVVNAMTKGGDTIPASAGTFASPISLAANSWGYRIDGAGGFGAGPTTVSTNLTTLSGNWAGVPNVNNAATIKTGTATSGQAIDIWFALGVPTGKPAGTYTQTIVLTVVGG